ncbi:MAG TPA: SDR family oxidoreductase [Ktedonobacteraceae bacterium]|jgi:NADP-dependent 3-hydroxy acid dehydrogenase YdfG|nr:SDR family oxidoreductase [Ktedonobacteraceae bacterium]
MSSIERIAGIKGKVVVITGASSGIGEATARLLGQQGARLLLGARRVDRLEALVSTIRTQGGTADYQTIDVTQREQVEALIGHAQQTYGRVDVIINNAGIMPLSALDQLKVDEWNRTIDVNIKGVLHGIAAGLPIMKEQQSGQFINISSIVGHAVFPMGTVYSATKAAVLAISEGLRQEVGRDIRVTVVTPGVVTSDLTSTISDAQLKQSVDEFRAVGISAEAIARAILFAIEQPEDVDVSEIIVRPTASTSSAV